MKVVGKLENKEPGNIMYVAVFSLSSPILLGSIHNFSLISNAMSKEERFQRKKFCPIISSDFFFFLMVLLN